MKTKTPKPKIKFGDYGIDNEADAPVIFLKNGEALNAYWLDSECWSDLSIGMFSKSFTKRGNIVNDMLRT